MNYILGISAFYHDSAACLIREGRLSRLLRKNGLHERRMIPVFLLMQAPTT